MVLFVYTYVGPQEIRRSVAVSPAGVPIHSRTDCEEWLKANADAVVDGATYVVDVEGRLRLAPRRSEHVACAGGGDVQAAGEIRFQRAGTQLTGVELSNQSTGYCPDTDCWAAVVLALRRAGITPPPGFASEVVFRRCARCDEINLVKEAWFVCVFCEADLPAAWNIAPRRTIHVDEEV